MVVVVYLHHQETSKLILLPAAFGVFLQGWKVWKVLTGTLVAVQNQEEEKKVAIAPGEGKEEKEETKGEKGGEGTDLTKVNTEKKGKKGKKNTKNIEADGLTTTQLYDRVAGAYLGQALYPLVVGSALFSLFCSNHNGTFDWFISSCVGAVYTFGFIAMTPQLFINYKLKSVAHLPWKFLIFRALNTFIDDLFAFIVRMPTMHRLSCFRDDIVFFIYIYQRWCYPVDVNRPAIGVEKKELGGEGEGTERVDQNKVVTEDSAVPMSSVPASDAKDAAGAASSS